MFFPDWTIHTDQIFKTVEEFQLFLNASNLTNIPFTSSKDGLDPLVEDIKFYVDGILTPIVCFLGMVGNVLAIITWRRPALRSSTAILLSAQGVADFGVLLMSLLYLSSRQWYHASAGDQVYAIIYSLVGMPLYYISLQCSVWLTLAVTIERYIMVCWATHAKTLTGIKQAKIGVAAILFASLISNCPRLFLYEVISRYGDYRDGYLHHGLVLVKTNFGTGKSELIYGLYLYCISLIAVPWFIVLFFNYKIVSAISTSNKKMLENKSSEASAKARKTEAQVTRLLIGVTFVYLVSMGPYCLLRIAIVLHEDGLNPRAKNAGEAITKFGHVINTSLNVILYCLMGRRFRRELKIMLGIKLSEADMSTIYSSSNGSSSDSTTKSTTGLKA